MKRAAMNMKNNLEIEKICRRYEKSIPDYPKVAKKNVFYDGLID